jgi:phasin
MNNTADAKSRTSKPYLDRSRTEGTEIAREYAQGAVDTAHETNRVLAQSYSVFTKSATDFNLEWIEMLRANTNSALDFSRQLVSAKSPSELLELSAAHARKQLETFTEQAKQLTSLAQKATTDVVGPLEAGVKNAFSKAA